MGFTSKHTGEFRTVWAVSLLAVLVIAVISTSEAYFANVMDGRDAVLYPSNFRWPFIFWGSWGILAPFIYWWSSRNLVEADTWKRTVIKLMLGAVVVGSVHILMQAASMQIVPAYRNLHGGTYWGAVAAHTGRSAIANLAIYGIIVGFVQGLGYYRRYKEEETNAILLQSTVARSELQMLRMQLQPHFLFNTLQSISTLMHRDVAAADQMLIKLSDLLRRVIDSTRTQLAPLSEEVAFMKAYLDIEQIRFEDRLVVEYEIAAGTESLEIPNLILQPMIENAIKHGFGRTGGEFRLVVRSEIVDGRLCLEVEDDGAGLSPDFSDTDYGLGLRLTRDRLRLIYDEDALMEISPVTGSGTRAKIEFPLPIQAK